MARITFAARLRPIAPDGPVSVEATTVGEALDAVFAEHGRLRGYVLTEQGHVRKHVALFLDGERLDHGVALATPVQRSSELYVLQALSGG